MVCLLGTFLFWDVTVCGKVATMGMSKWGWCQHVAREALQISHAFVTLGCTQGKICPCSSTASDCWFQNVYSVTFNVYYYLRKKNLGESFKINEIRMVWVATPDHVARILRGLWFFFTINLDRSLFFFFDLISIVHALYTVLFFSERTMNEKVLIEAKFWKCANVSTCAEAWVG